MGIFDFFKKKSSDEYYDDEVDYTYEYDESISVEDAAEIWYSNGMDEDYMFGYTREELIEALDDF